MAEKKIAPAAGAFSHKCLAMPLQAGYGGFAFVFMHPLRYCTAFGREDKTPLSICALQRMSITKITQPL